MALLSTTVVGLHLFLFLLPHHDQTLPSTPKKSLIVHTVVIPAKESPRVTSDTRQEKRANPSSSKQHPSLSAKEGPSSKLKKALAKASLKPPPTSSLELPGKISTLHVDHADKKEENEYLVVLAHALKEALELPEQGAVKIELTLNCLGQVLKLRILSALSESNRLYLERNIPKLSLPPFSEDLKNHRAHTFILTFCNSN